MLKRKAPKAFILVCLPVSTSLMPGDADLQGFVENFAIDLQLICGCKAAW